MRDRIRDRVVRDITLWTRVAGRSAKVNIVHLHMLTDIEMIQYKVPL